MPRAIDGWKVCSRCQGTKLTSEFGKSEQTADRLYYWCKACCRAARKRYRASSKGKQVDKRYKARKAGCIGSHTAAEFAALCERHGFRCLGCGEQFSLAELTEDHVIPIGPDVSDNIDNIQPLCGPCNSWKGRRTIDFRRKEVYDNTKLGAIGPLELPGKAPMIHP